MNDAIYMALALLTGVALGSFFFGGLWWTVRKAVHAKIPALWFGGSLMIRMAVTMSGFYLIGAGSWQRLLVCGIGFALARMLVIRFTKIRDEKVIQQEKR
jgi:F1/F0 ATPase, Methanosarcina type, subunit 2